MDLVCNNRIRHHPLNNWSVGVIMFVGLVTTIARNDLGASRSLTPEIFNAVHTLGYKNKSTDKASNN